MSISDNIAVMDRGVLQQYEAPQNMYLNPENLFVAQFLGMPQINTFDVIAKDNIITANGLILRNNCNIPDGKYIAGVRPESFEINKGDNEVVANSVRMTGRDLLINFGVGSDELRVLVHSDLQIQKDQKFNIDIRDKHLMLFDQNKNIVGKF